MPDPSVSSLSEEPARKRSRRITRQSSIGVLSRTPYTLVILMLAILTAVLWNVGWSFDRVNMAMLYLLPVLFSAVRFGRGPAYLAAGLGVLLFDFFFVPPLLSFTVSDFRYLISFAVFLLVAGLTATQASRLRQQLREAKEREAKTASLYAISQQIVAVPDLDAMLQVIVQHLTEALHVPAATLLPDSAGLLQLAQKTEGNWVPELDSSLSDLVLKNGQMAGQGTRTFGETGSLYLPLKTDSRIYGVLCVRVGDASIVAPEQLAFIEAVADLASVSIARVKLEEEAKMAQLSAESERLRTALLNSISHELRTPLASIIGSATGILEGMDLLSQDDQKDLLSTIRDGALRMNRLVSNLLGMVRIESGMLQLKRQWCDMADILGVCLRQFADPLRQRQLRVSIPDDIPAVYVDDILIEQVLSNVISNALKYSEEQSEIFISVRDGDRFVEIAVCDHGIGINAEDRPRIFEKFYRSERTSHIPGTGLGLAICKSIALAHGGDIRAQVSESGGTEIILTLTKDAV